MVMMEMSVTTSKSKTERDNRAAVITAIVIGIIGVIIRRIPVIRSRRGRIRNYIG